MIELEDLGLTPKDLRKVKDWLKNLAAHFENKADNRKATVERYNLLDLDFFYFTDCRDVLNKNPESKGQEDSALIRKRKRAVEYSLIFRRLMGEQMGRNRACSHCGNAYRWINSLGDGTGHYVYCPKCAMTTVVTYPCGYDTCIERIKEDIFKNEELIINENEKVTGERLELFTHKFSIITTEDGDKRYESGTQNSILPKEPPLKTIPGFLRGKKKKQKNTKKHMC